MDTYIRVDPVKESNIPSGRVASPLLVRILFNFWWEWHINGAEAETGSKSRRCQPPGAGCGSAPVAIARRLHTPMWCSALTQACKLRQRSVSTTLSTSFRAACHIYLSSTEFHEKQPANSSSEVTTHDACSYRFHEHRVHVQGPIGDSSAP